MKTKPNFRLSADQTVDFIEHGPYHVTFLGKCPLTGTRLYDLPEGSFPEHQATRFKAVDFGLTGADFIASANTCADHAGRSFAELIAKSTWKGNTVKPLTNAYVIGTMARKHQCSREEIKELIVHAPHLLESSAAEILLNRLAKSRKKAQSA
jgi:hypothetical protein